MRIVAARIRASTCSMSAAWVVCTTTTPSRPKPASSSTAMPIVSRARIPTCYPSCRDDRQCGLGRRLLLTRVVKGVAEPTHRADHLRVAVVELAAEVADIRLDGGRIAGETIIPNVLQDLMLGEDTATVEHQVAE